jgi:WD40 repeat protein
MTDAFAQPDPAPRPPDTPYVGLVPYGEDDAAFFFGRDEEKWIVGGNLRASRLTILYGASGVGKTSLLRAGAIHDLRNLARDNALTKLERTPFAICVFAAWRDDPLPALMETIRGVAAEVLGVESLSPWQPGEPAADRLRSWTEEVRTLLVVLDQFEDYFLYHPGEDGENTFAGEFPAIVNDPNLRVHFLLSIREDALAKLDRFKGRIPRLFANYVRIEHLNRAAARRAIEGPIDEWNRRRSPQEPAYTLEPALVEAVIDATATGALALGVGVRDTTSAAADVQRVEAPFLQIVMERLWRATVDTRAHDLTVSRLDELGGAERIVENHLLEALASLSKSEQAVAAGAFRFLVTSTKTKIAHPASDLAEWTRRPEPEVAAVLEKLCRGESGRILRRIPPPATDNGETRYELFHDVLAEPIAAWRADYEQDQRRRATVRRFARVGGALVLLAAVFATLGIWALVQRNEARSATRSAASLALASAAKDLLPSRVDAALLLGLEAYRESPSPEAASAMVASFSAARRSGAVAILRGHPRAVRAIAMSPDDRTLASADFDGTLRLWDLRERRPIGEPLRGHEDAVWSIGFSPDAKTLASASHDGTVRLWDGSDGTPLGVLASGDRGLISSVAWSRDGTTLASAGEAGIIQLWDPKTQKALGPPLEAHRGRIVSLAFSPVEGTLASAGYDGNIRFWDVRSRRPIGQIENAHDGRVLSIAWSPDGQALVTSGTDGLIHIWDARSRRPLGDAFGPDTGDIWSVAWSPDGRTIASSGEDNTVRLWDARDGTPMGEPLRGHRDRVVAVAFAPDGRTLASSSYDSTVRIWKMPAPAVLGEAIERHPDQVKAVAYSPDGRLLASADFGGLIKLWDLRSRKLHSQLDDGETTSIEIVAWSPDGQTLASAGDGGSIVLWDVAGGTPTATLDGHDETVQSVAWSPDGSMLASAGLDDTVRLWDVAERAPLGQPLRGHEGEVWSVAWSPDGRTLASVGADGTLRLWDASTRAALSQVSLADDDVGTSVAFGPDGHTLAIGTIEGRVQLWDVDTRARLGEPLSGHDLEVRAVAFSPDGRQLVSAGEDGSVRLWDVGGRRALGGPLGGGDGDVLSVAFSPDGRTVASGDSDGAVRLWYGILWHDLADLKRQVCSLVVGNLTEPEWQELVPGLEYRTTCPT